MMNVALNYKDVKTICPSDIEISSVSTNVCCLSGPKASLKSFATKLQVSHFFLEVAIKLQMKYTLYNRKLYRRIIFIPGNWNVTIFHFIVIISFPQEPRFLVT